MSTAAMKTQAMLIATLMTQQVIIHKLIHGYYIQKDLDKIFLKYSLFVSILYDCKYFLFRFLIR